RPGPEVLIAWRWRAAARNARRACDGGARPQRGARGEPLMDGAAMLAELRARFGSDVVETHEHRGDHTAVVTREALRRVLAWCRDEPSLAFEMLTDLTAVDYVKYPGRQDGPRFEVVYHLYSLTHNQDRKSTRLNSSHEWSSYAVFCLKKK